MENLAKKVVSILSIIILTAFTICNVFFIVTVTNFAENVFIEYTISVSLVISLVIDIILVCLFKLLNGHTKINKKIVVICSIIIYMITSIIWINTSNVEPIDDSKSVNDLAIELAAGNMESIEKSEYIEKYPNQIGMITIFAFIYKIFGSDNYRILQYVNVVANVLTVIFMALILNKLSKKYKINEIAYYVCSMTFIPLIMLTTYVYGDYLGLCFSVIGIYFIIDYKETNQFAKCILSAIFMGLSYFTKMNYIIVIISIFIYLALYLMQERNKRRIVNSMITIIVFLLIAIAPLSIVKKVWINKFEYNTSQSIPTSVWIYIGMSESYRANGWYSDLAGEAWDDTPLSRSTYPKKINTRVKELIMHPRYTAKFYIKKTISGWCDPYFQSLWYNVGVENKDQDMQNIINGKKYKIGAIYQKSLITLIYGGTLIALITNRKNLTNEFILMITIFIGGVLFHTLWEMKSRYTMPYVIMLIPIANLGIQQIVKKIKFRNIEEIE